MNKSALSSVPTWRIACYGLFAALGVSSYGVYRSQYPLIICGFFAGAAIFGFGLLLNWIAQGRWGVRHMRLVLAVYVALQAVMLIWTLLEKKH